MEGLRDIIGLKEFVVRGEAALVDAERLDVRRHPAGRFDQYLNVLLEAAALTYPRPFPWDGDDVRRAIFFEADSQMQQLIDAASIWRTMDPVLAAKKVRLIMSGVARPPIEDDTSDVARNTLFEFAVAKALATKGFEVTLTADDADVIATYPGLTPFDVECKRPTHRESLPANVKKANSQLRRRCASSGRLGFAVFGVERMLRLGRSTPNLSSFEELDRGIDQILRGHIVAVRAAERSAEVSSYARRSGGWCAASGSEPARPHQQEGSKGFTSRDPGHVLLTRPKFGVRKRWPKKAPPTMPARAFVS
jgi:hypothetical protein